MNWARTRQLMVVALVAVAIWILQDSLLPVQPRLPPQGSEVPDYAMKGFVITAYGKDGLPQHYLQAKEMARYEEAGVTKLVSPFLIVESAGAQSEQWYVLADSGEIRDQGDEVWLYGNVRVEKPASGSRIETEKLLISPSREYAETDMFVSFIDLDAKIEAVGMRAHLKDQRVEFMSEVKGLYYAR